MAMVSSQNAALARRSPGEPPSSSGVDRLWPVAGEGLAGAFFTTIDAQGQVVAASPGGPRLLPTVDGGRVSGLTVTAAGLIAAVGVRNQPTVELLRLAADGGAATPHVSIDDHCIYLTSSRAIARTPK